MKDFLVAINWPTKTLVHNVMGLPTSGIARGMGVGGVLRVCCYIPSTTTAYRILKQSCVQIVTMYLLVHFIEQPSL